MSSKKRAFEDTKGEDTKGENTKGENDEKRQHKRAKIQDYIARLTLHDATQILGTVQQNLIQAKLVAANKKERDYARIKKIRKELLGIKEAIATKAIAAKAMPQTQVTGPAPAMSLTQAIALLTPPTQAPLPIEKLTEASAPIEQLTEEEERERSITLHLELLLHTVACIRKSCSSENCKKMKGFLSHGATCIIDKCTLCQRISKLLKLHSERCNLDRCNVRNCRRNIAHM